VENSVSALHRLGFSRLDFVDERVDNGLNTWGNSVEKSVFFHFFSTFAPIVFLFYSHPLIKKLAYGRYFFRFFSVFFGFPV
jgi:hypothetical protein